MSLSIENRNKSYKEELPKLSKKRSEIFEIIRLTPGITAFDISQMYNLNINQVTGRITELKDLCLITEFGFKSNLMTNKTNTRYRVINDTEEFLKLQKIRFVMLRNKKDMLLGDLHHIANISPLTRGWLRKEVDKLTRKIKQLGDVEQVISEVEA
tara:strand:+ start:8093 stop:8557 length:465 start_codon:yes stop_codon:yes gene_type:complete